MRRSFIQWVGLGLICASLQGCLGYKSQFSCVGDPDGGVCDSVPDVYRLGNSTTEPGSDGMQGGEWARVNGTHETVLGKPIINGPVVYTGWIAPWKDGNGSRVFEGSIVYLLIEGPSFDYGQPGQIAGRERARVITPIPYPQSGKSSIGRPAFSSPKEAPKGEDSQEYVNRALKNIQNYQKNQPAPPAYRPVQPRSTSVRGK